MFEVKFIKKKPFQNGVYNNEWEKIKCVSTAVPSIDGN